MIKKEHGFTLIEILLVLFIVLTLIFVTSNMFVKVKERITFQTYAQQFKLLTYEAYATALEDLQIMQIYCNNNEPYIKYRHEQMVRRQLFWPDHMRMECFMYNGETFAFSGEKGVRYQGSVVLHDTKENKKVRYTVNFTYGRLREDK